MANRTLTTSYFARLSNANHDGVTQQCCDRLTGFTTDNAPLTIAIQQVLAARQAEDTAFKRFSGKDFASDDLKKEDGLEDKYMSTILGILNGLLNLPETEPIYRKAQLARQVFKDFNFSTKDGFEAEARKVINMAQQWQAATEYTLAELGIEEWVNKAVAQANKVLNLVTVRVDNESAKVKGELADARKATDEAIRKAYDILNALNVLQPTPELAALINVLFSIEDRARLYYISGGKVNGNSGTGTSSNENEDQNENGGTTEPTTPENPENPDTPVTPGNGGDNGGGGGGGTGDDDIIPGGFDQG